MDAIEDMPNSVDSTVFADPTDGIVRWSATKPIWWLVMTLIWIFFAVSTVSISALLVFLALSVTTLCLGHSLGMHRKLIHQSFQCSKWLERIFVYLSTLVGLGGRLALGGLGWISFGECWHNNHHAFPGSAKLGLGDNQFDPGWQVLRLLSAMKFVWKIKTPKDIRCRNNLFHLNQIRSPDVVQKIERSEKTSNKQLHSHE